MHIRTKFSYNTRSKGGGQQISPFHPFAVWQRISINERPKQEGKCNKTKQTSERVWDPKKKTIVRFSFCALGTGSPGSSCTGQEAGLFGNMLLSSHGKSKHFSEPSSEKTSFLDSDNAQASLPSEITAYCYFSVLLTVSCRKQGPVSCSGLSGLAFT